MMIKNGTVLAAVCLVLAAGAAAQGTGDAAPEAGTVRTFAGIEFVWCPPGRYACGAGLSAREIAERFGGREEWYADELPRHTVTFSRGFWISKTEITKAQWERVMRSTPWDGQQNAGGGVPDTPAVYVSWEAAQRFAVALGRSGEGRFRLPNEAEWEYACRAGSAGPYFFGEDEKGLGEHAWFRDNTVAEGNPMVQPVGRKTPNAWGIHDMLGNAWEWCEDVYGPHASRETRGEDTRSPLYRSVRGGSFALQANALRVSFRNGQLATLEDTRTGFRLVREP
jgi:formylglycine-generating enzyme required for sulfatase activity